MSIAALFKIARNWISDICSLTREWAYKNVVHLHNELLFSCENEIINITGKWMVLEKSFTEWVNPDPKRQILYVFLLYMNVYLFKPSISVGQSI